MDESFIINNEIFHLKKKKNYSLWFHADFNVLAFSKKYCDVLDHNIMVLNEYYIHIPGYSDDTGPKKNSKLHAIQSQFIDLILM